MAEETKEPPNPVDSTRLIIDGIRKRADTSSKLIAGVATALAGYIGVTELSEVFPLVTDQAVTWVFLGLTVLALVLLVEATKRWTGLLARVSAPIGMHSGIVDGAGAGRAGELDLDAEEVKLVGWHFDEFAKRNSGLTPAAAQAEIARLNAVIGDESSTPELAANAMTRAAGLAAELNQTYALAAADVVRRRYHQAFTSPPAGHAIVRGAIGFVLLSFSLGLLAGESQGRLDRAKQCVDIDKTMSESGVHRPVAPCDAIVGAAEAPPSTPPPTEDERRKAALAHAASVAAAEKACGLPLATKAAREACTAASDAVPEE